MTALRFLFPGRVRPSRGPLVARQASPLSLSCAQRVTCGEHELPLSYGQRVTFFAGAKKVTKETPSKAEPAQEDTLGFRKECEGSHAQLGLRTSSCAASDCSAEAASKNHGALNESARFSLRRASVPANRWRNSARRICRTDLVSLRRTSCLWNFSRARRTSASRTWARSDSKRCFFGDFLCTSKESYPLLRRRSGSSSSPRILRITDSLRSISTEIASGAPT